MERGAELKEYIGLHLVLIFYAVGGIFSKRAAVAPFLSVEYIGNYAALLAVLVVYAYFWQKILKKLPLTVAMANKSITVIWGIIYGYLVFHEKVTFFNLAGAVIIILGICLVIGADKEEIETKEQKSCT